jgi:hypothetical protein
MVQAIGANMSNHGLIEVAVARDPRMLNFLDTYASLTKRPLHVFPTLAEARCWLETPEAEAGRFG